jgi:hypothetical protein
MSAKITTEACLANIAAVWPASFPALAAGFKRISKTGKSGEPVERLFFHRSLPLKAVVLEEHGVIVSTVISAVGPWEVTESDAETAQAMYEIILSDVGIAFLAGEDFFKPEDFYFYVSDVKDEDMGGQCWFKLVPISFWHEHDYDWDDELSPYIGRYLPEGSVETKSGYFTSNFTPEKTGFELLKKGFRQDFGFDAYVVRLNA